MANIITVKELSRYMYAITKANDLSGNYNLFLDVYQFIHDFAVDSYDIKVHEEEPCDYVTITRKAKGINNWFVGNTSDANVHTLKIK